MPENPILNPLEMVYFLKTITKGCKLLRNLKKEKKLILQKVTIVVTMKKNEPQKPTMKYTS